MKILLPIAALTVSILLTGSNANAQEATMTKQKSSFKYTPIKEKKWDMFSLYRWHVQDFTTTDRVDSCNCVTDGRFFDKANANVGLSYYGNLSKKMAASVDLMIGYGSISRRLGSANDKTHLTMRTIRGDLYYNLTSTNTQLQSYAFTAFHGSMRSGNFYLTIPYGLGVRYMFMKNNGMLTAQVGHGLGVNNRLRNSMVISSGLYISLNKKKREIKESVIDEPKDDCCNIPLVDTDCDGLVDSLDKCPTVVGLPSNNGCPISDRDGDGVVDDQDKCPDVKGLVTANGCPIEDTDGDGIEDSKDQCPTEPGSAYDLGCPVTDRDKDGVPDKNDLCPDVPGPSSNQGCPLIDTDKDGIPDKMDLCPEVPGIAIKQGCPEQENSIDLSQPKYIIYFDFDKYYLTKKSISTLNDLIDFLKNNPAYGCQLVGHTDEEGSSGYNVVLSSNRVKTTKNYIINKGIGPDRIKTDYKGKVQPVVNTKDKAIAERNRRVEIYLMKK
jgi:outer membrane protein OmpA-like peptidoglycan-associated protein